MFLEMVNQHRATSSRPRNPLAICDVCGKQLARQSDMPRHKRLHDPKPERWMHWCPEPDCDYGSMQRSNLRNHIRKHTGQRLRCPDDVTCNYSTFDKSALLRHRQRRHGYKTKSTARKDRNLKITEKRTERSHELESSRSNSGSNSTLTSKSSRECPRPHPCPCPCPCILSPNCRIDGTMEEEMEEWNGANGDHVHSESIEQLVESEERSLEGGHVISRFPLSFARTRLPTNDRMLSNHCRRCTTRFMPTRKSFYIS
ncbi:hypothetical protein B0F90DRAFT_318186 [Multifurca ochricompacta]|uniref:C2H2-type domain-containing protein n=1 Tax=Multifurca ochricompacta TaxID=376703 RepID=A0AAD4M6K4_9AGAM|nr:hypothetical protein B0F90DRAFT_318186 [Multifurca ochricompacta]